MQMIKNSYHKLIGKPTTSSDKNDRDTYRIGDLKDELDKAKEEIRELKNEIKEKDKEIARLKSGGE